MSVITRKDRLEHFSQAFDRMRPYLGNMTEERKDSLKDDLAIAVSNFSDRVSLQNSFAGTGVATDPISAIYKPIEARLESEGVNFSNDIKGLHSQNVSTMVLQAQYQSYGLGYIADTFGMDHEQTVYNFQKLTAVNNFGIYETGDTVLDPRTSPHPMLQYTGAGITEKTVSCGSGNTPDGTVNFSMPIRCKSLVIEGIKSDGTREVVAFDSPDSPSKGTLAMKAPLADSITVDYTTGTVTFNTPKAVSAFTKFEAVASYDVTADAAQARVPQFKAGNETITLEASAHSFSLIQNLEDIVKMNKIYNVNKPAGLVPDYAKNTVDMLMSTYIRNIDANIMLTMITPFIKYLTGITDTGLPDLTNWANSGNFNLFEGKINTIISHINLLMSGDTDGRTPTALIVDTLGANTLMASREFVKAGAALGFSDGFIGTISGIPVIRSRVMDYHFSASWKQDRGKPNPRNVYDTISRNLSVGTGGDTYFCMFAVHKDPASRTSPIVFGNFIPPYAVAQVPSHGGNIVTHTINTEYAVKMVLPNLIQPILVKVSGIPEIKRHAVRV